MASPRTKSLPLFLAMLFALLVCIVSASAAGGAPSPKPSLICHTSNPEECYPRVFQPTDEFQTIHDDQELPKGLHVRLNIWTGKKEAKINVPDETNPSLEGLPVDKGVMVVEPEQPEEPETPQIPKGAPEYENVGKIKEPENKGSGEAQRFAQAAKMLKSGSSDDDEAFDSALEGMEELSHDIYYGLKITEDPAVLKALLCMMDIPDLTARENATPRDEQAATILAGALQNNPTALKEVTKEWSNLMAAECPRDGKPLVDGFYSTFVPSNTPAGANEKVAAAKAKARVSAINGLLKSDTIRADFLQRDGMRGLLEVLIPQGKEWATAQRKVGQLVVDTFLDEDMGASLGEWPRAAKAGDAQCAAAGTQAQTDEGCWDYHVEAIARANKRGSSHWSKDLLDRLTALRNKGDIPAKHVEL